jgi:predicted nucleic acid-binding protein
VKAFIDTSSLFKRYTEEPGSTNLVRLLDGVSELIVSCVTWLEITSTVERHLRTKLIKRDEAAWIKAEIKKDFNYYLIVVWNENLEQKAEELISRYGLKTLDSIQLAAACLSAAEMFITSDKRLGSYARREISDVQIIL